jgi:4'-phosphopantetheinyl transferase
VDTLAVIGVTEQVLSAYPETLLNDMERQRADAFKFDVDRRDFVAAHLLVRACGGEILGCPPDKLNVAQLCPTCAGPHGPPRLVEAPELAVSLAHTRGYVAACAGPGPVGVDVERLDGRRFSVLFDVLAEAEARWVRASADARRAFLELWVRKEALIKAGYATLDALPAVDLVGDLGEVASRWREMWLTGFDDGVMVGACASAEPVRVRVGGDGSVVRHQDHTVLGGQ